MIVTQKSVPLCLPKGVSTIVCPTDAQGVPRNPLHKLIATASPFIAESYETDCLEGWSQMGDLRVYRHPDTNMEVAFMVVQAEPGDDIDITAWRVASVRLSRAYVQGDVMQPLAIGYPKGLPAKDGDFLVWRMEDDNIPSKIIWLV
jgi:hypothetical protein